MGAALTFVLLATAASRADPAAPTALIERPYQGLAVATPLKVEPARVGGIQTLRYELHLTNFGARNARLNTIEVLADGRTIGDLDVRSIVRIVGSGGAIVGGTIAPGQVAVAYIDLPLPAARPARLTHRVLYEMAAGAASDLVVVTGGAAAIAPARAVTLGPPLRGGPWVAVYDPAMDLGHRRYIYAVSGAARIPGRFAVDWMPAQGFAASSTGRRVSADGSGADVLAVADATVVTVRRAQPEQRTGVESEVGNAIVLDLGRGRFAFYEHLADEISLKAGDRVSRGQVIARLGASGHVTQPHLHFHVADGPAFLSAEGLPYRMPAGRSVGRYASIADYRPSAAWDRTPSAVVDFPMPMHVVEFR